VNLALLFGYLFIIFSVFCHFLPVKSMLSTAPSSKTHIVFFPREHVIEFHFHVSRPLVRRCLIHILVQILAIFAEDLFVLLTPTRQMMG